MNDHSLTENRPFQILPSAATRRAQDIEEEISKAAKGCEKWMLVGLRIRVAWFYHPQNIVRW